MQALGMIETRGLLASIEAADAMLKAADVTLLDRTKVGGGLVTISVTGDVAAVLDRFPLRDYFGTITRDQVLDTMFYVD